MSPRPLIAVAALLVATAITSLNAVDRWEGATFTTDDDPFTHNEMRPGDVQVGHELPAGDEDWYAVKGTPGHSYEAVVGSGTTLWSTPTCNGCARFDRVAANGSIIASGVADGATHSFQPGSLALRFLDDSGATHYLRAQAQIGFTALDTYDIRLRDTTYLLPRFNNSGTQVTILIVQNATAAAVTGTLYFRNAAGTLLYSQFLAFPAHGGAVFNTATAGALVGQSGSMTLAHNGPYGALAGKGVSLEPATGFTFDTALTAITQ
jgi:hypothetical protein